MIHRGASIILRVLLVLVFLITPVLLSPWGGGIASASADQIIAPTQGRPTRIEAEINPSGDEDNYYIFSVPDFARITITMVREACLLCGNLDPYLELYETYGTNPANAQRVATGDDELGSLNAKIEYVKERVAGYRIKARDYSRKGTGKYTLTVSIALDNSAPKRFGYVPGTYDETLVNSSQVHYWVFPARAGQQLTVRMDNLTSSLDPILELWSGDSYYGNGNVQRLASSDDEGRGPTGRSSLIERYTLPTDGPFTIEAHAYSRTSGPYRLSFQLSAAAAAPPSSGGGNTRNVTVLATSGWQGYGIRVSSGQTVTISSIGGVWRISPNDPATNGEGQRGRYLSCAIAPSVPISGLIARVGTGRIRPVPAGDNGPVLFTAGSDESGELFFSINDCPDFSDNGGFLSISVNVR